MAGNTNGRAPRSRSHRTVAPTTTSMSAIPRLPAPTATVSPRLTGSSAACRVPATLAGMSATRGRAKVWRTRSMVGNMGPIIPPDPSPCPGGTIATGETPTVLYVWANFSMQKLPVSLTRFLLAALLLASGGCAWLRPAPTPILPPDELYSQGESELERRRYIEAREAFRKIVERHPNTSWAPRARFLIGEA